MLMKIATLLFVLTFTLVCNGIDYEPECPESPCFEYTLKECVGRLWDVPQNLTANVKEFRDAIKCLATNANDRLLGQLLTISLWSIDHFTGMPTNVHPSCVQGALLNRTLVSNLANDLCATEGLTKAFNDFAALAAYAIDNTLYVGMKSAGCKVKVPRQNCTKACNLGSAPLMFLVDATSEVPKTLKPIMSKLACSSHPDDKAVAAAAFATSTKSNIDFIQNNIISLEAFKKLVQLKCCKVKVAKECCKHKEEEIRYWVDASKRQPN